MVERHGRVLRGALLAAFLLLVYMLVPFLTVLLAAAVLVVVSWPLHRRLTRALGRVGGALASTALLVGAILAAPAARRRPRPPVRDVRGVRAQRDRRDVGDRGGAGGGRLGRVLGRGRRSRRAARHRDRAVLADAPRGLHLRVGPGRDRARERGHWGKAVFVAVWSLALTGTVDNVLKPLVFQRGLDVHPVLVLMSLLAGMASFGPAGVLLGPLVLVTFLTLWTLYERDVLTATDERSS